MTLFSIQNFTIFVKYISPHGFTSATTNATALTQKNMEKVIEAGLGRLTISFNGTDPELYEMMMGGLKFQRAEDHLKMALDLEQGHLNRGGCQCQCHPPDAKSPGRD